MDLATHLTKDHVVTSFKEYKDGEKRAVFCVRYHEGLHLLAKRNHTHDNMGHIVSYVTEEVSPPRPRKEA